MAHYTRGQIASEAEAIINNDNLGTVTDAAINRVLNQIYTAYEWGFLISKATLTFSGSAVASAALPTDYNGHLHAKWRDTSQTPTFEHNLAWMDYSQYLTLNAPNQTSNVPQRYTISPMVGHDSNGATGNLLIWPTFDTASNPNIELTYYRLPSQITKGSGGDGAVPLFQNYNFLVEATVNELYRYLRDQRFDPLFIRRHIGEVRDNMGDFGAVSQQTIGLDPRFFKNHKARFGF